MTEPIMEKMSVYSLKDSFNFINKTDGINLDRKYEVSLNVESLLTKSPLKKDY